MERLFAPLQVVTCPRALEWHLGLRFGKSYSLCVRGFVEAKHAPSISGEEGLQKADLVGVETPGFRVFLSLNVCKFNRLFEPPFDEYEFHGNSISGLN
jgi:hypothetical protein